MPHTIEASCEDTSRRHRPRRGRGRRRGARRNLPEGGTRRPVATASGTLGEDAAREGRTFPGGDGVELERTRGRSPCCRELRARRRAGRREHAWPHSERPVVGGPRGSAPGGGVVTTSGGRTRVPYGRLLVVEDDDAVFRSLERIISRHRPVKHVESFERALGEIQGRGKFCGFLFDQRLGDRREGGTELLALARCEHASVPAALVTGYVDAALVNRVAALGAIVLSKPVDESALGPFFQRVVARDHRFAKDFAERLDAVSRDFKFSPREHEICAWFVAGGTREGFLAFSGMADTTFKTHVKHILAKTSATKLAEAVSMMLRRVVDSELAWRAPERARRPGHAARSGARPPGAPGMTARRGGRAALAGLLCRRFRASSASWLPATAQVMIAATSRGVGARVMRDLPSSSGLTPARSASTSGSTCCRAAGGSGPARRPRSRARIHRRWSHSSAPPRRSRRAASRRRRRPASTGSAFTMSSRKSSSNAASAGRGARAGRCARGVAHHPLAMLEDRVRDHHPVVPRARAPAEVLALPSEVIAHEREHLTDHPFLRHTDEVRREDLVREDLAIEVGQDRVEESSRVEGLPHLVVGGARGPAECGFPPPPAPAADRGRWLGVRAHLVGVGMDLRRARVRLLRPALDAANHLRQTGDEDARASEIRRRASATSSARPRTKPSARRYPRRTARTRSVQVLARGARTCREDRGPGRATPEEEPDDAPVPDMHGVANDPHERSCAGPVGDEEQVLLFGARHVVRAAVRALVFELVTDRELVEDPLAHRAARQALDVELEVLVLGGRLASE